LVLTVRRIVTVPARSILYSLPTICAALPGLDHADSTVDRFDLHEDDWRQIEFVSAGHTGTVEAEFDAIRRVYQESSVHSGGITAFREIHVRTQPAAPLATHVPLDRLLEVLPMPHRTYDGVGFHRQAGVAGGSFAFDLGSVVLYGLAEQGAATVLCLSMVASPAPPPADGEVVAWIQRVMDAFDVILTDWCRCAAFGPDSLDQFLTGER
jgi:hypothetical protein